VSADLLLDEPQFRAGMRARLAAARPGFEQYLAAPVRAADHPIVLALITNTAATGLVAAGLPFFTKVFLRQNVRRLRNMGFDLFIDEIAVAPAQVSSLPPRPARHRRRRSGPTPTQPVTPRRPSGRQ
jgi:hypothetical protein